MIRWFRDNDGYLVVLIGNRLAITSLKKWVLPFFVLDSRDRDSILPRYVHGKDSHGNHWRFDAKVLCIGRLMVTWLFNKEAVRGYSPEMAD